MFVVRETFTAKPGKASQLAQLFKQVMSEMPRMKPRMFNRFHRPVQYGRARDRVLKT